MGQGLFLCPPITINMRQLTHAHSDFAAETAEVLIQAERTAVRGCLTEIPAGTGQKKEEKK